MEQLYNEIREEFKKLTGKYNYKLYKSVYFIPTYNTFKKRLDQACREYKMDDVNKIKTILLRHVQESIKNKFPKYTRTLQYFIYGQDGKDCNLADEYFNEEVLSDTELEKINKKSNKELFG